MKFNITGLCIPEKHYMVDMSVKLDAIMVMIEEGDYFVINRPRQYGKTTILSLLENRLQKPSNYMPLSISFEGIGEKSYEDEGAFITALMRRFRKVFRRQQHDEVLSCIEAGTQLETLSELDEWISDLVTTIAHPLVLMIDEVDKSSNHQLFLNFLGLLRTKYLEAERGKDVTFHSVILAGVHDVKSLKLKLRPDDERNPFDRYNSPWNIAVDFTVDLGFSPPDIATMLADYCDTTGVEMDLVQIADSLWYYTSGYPFLVSALCKIIAEEIQPPTPGPSQEGNKWLPEHVDEAVNCFLAQSNTNFDHLIKNLENNQELYSVVEKVVLRGEQVSYHQYSPMIQQGVMYGILTRHQNVVDLHNRIYRELIYDYMTTNLEVRGLSDAHLSSYNLQEQFLLPDQTLDIERVVLKFQECLKHEYSPRDVTFLERNGRLLFFAFLKPILNSRGYAFKEPQISEEKQLDVVITFGSHSYIIELKIWHGEKKHQKGLQQLYGYLERTGHERGYLIIFDLTKKGQKTWKQDRIQVDGKEIFAVWV